jgi:hypothetical protein
VLWLAAPFKPTRKVLAVRSPGKISGLRGTTENVANVEPWNMTADMFSQNDMTGAAWKLAVIVEALSPNEMLFEFENVIAERLFEVVPADTLIAVRLVAMLAVMVEALRPKLTPFEFEKVKADARFDVVPADRLIEP